jgi:hypothetical protein
MLVSSVAFANGRYPASNQLVIQPGNTSTLAIRTTFGTLISRDRQNFDWICESAVGFGLDGGTEDPGLALTSGGTMLEGVQRGLSVSKDGCSWAFALNVPVADVTAVRATPGSALAMTAQPIQLHLTTDDGQNFAPYGVPIDATVLGLTLDAAPSDPHTIYVTGERSFLGSASLFVSIDDAKTWTERPIPLTQAEAGAYILAIDPKNPARVYLRTYDASSTRLLVTDDAGKTFTTKFSGGKSTDGLAAALSPDGSKIWIGSDFDGLQVASTTDFAFSKISFLQPQCLASDGTHLYMCLRDATNTFLVVSDNGGQTFSPLLKRCAVRGPLACTSCAPEWPAIAQVLAVPCPPPMMDAGVSDSGTNADAGPTMKPTGGCSCSSSSGAPVDFGVLTLLFLVSSRPLWARGVRRRARTPRP